MKKVILILTILGLLFSGCNNDNKKDEQKKQQAIIAGWFLGCQFSSSNPLFTDPYYGRYISDQRQYRILILGNSTEDIACNSFEGYRGPETGCFPVSGNKLPDMETQLCVLNTINPEWIIVGTMGGNDLLGQIDDTEIIKRGKSLIDSIDRKYPNAGKVFIKVHPTRVDYANQHRDKTNSEISSYAISKGWKVTDPDSCFQVDSEGRALQSYLLDAIHPNSSTSFCIKNKIKIEHGVVY